MDYSNMAQYVKAKKAATGILPQAWEAQSGYQAYLNAEKAKRTATAAVTEDTRQFDTDQERQAAEFATSQANRTADIARTTKENEDARKAAEQQGYVSSGTNLLTTGALAYALKAPAAGTPGADAGMVDRVWDKGASYYDKVFGTRYDATGKEIPGAAERLTDYVKEGATKVSDYVTGKPTTPPSLTPTEGVDQTLRIGDEARQAEEALRLSEQAKNVQQAGETALEYSQRMQDAKKMQDAATAYEQMSAAEKGYEGGTAVAEGAEAAGKVAGASDAVAKAAPETVSLWGAVSPYISSALDYLGYYGEAKAFGTFAEHNFNDPLTKNAGAPEYPIGDAPGSISKLLGHALGGESAKRGEQISEKMRAPEKWLAGENPSWSDTEEGFKYIEHPFMAPLETIGVDKSVTNAVAAVLDPIGAIFCFVAGTKIQMADGSTKNVEDIDLGDETLLGGTVIGLGKAFAEEIYNYKGVVVQGEHAVFDGKWARVRDTEATPVSFSEPTIVYPLVTMNHLLVINGIVFADLVETARAYDYTEAQRIDLLNEDVMRNAFIMEFMDANSKI